jgi:histidine triad (HIT) family protein
VSTHAQGPAGSPLPDVSRSTVPELQLVQPGCTFCGIVARDVRAEVLYENDHVMVFMDLLPMTRGHCLVIPRAHRDDLLHVQPHESVSLIDAAQRVGRAFLEVLGAKGFNMLTNIGAHADQSQFHAHLHLVARYGDDRLLHPWERRFGHWPEIQETADLLRQAASLA